MSLSRSRRLLGLLAAAALAVALVPISALGTTGIETGAFSQRAPAGTLTLITASAKSGPVLRVEHRGVDGELVDSDEPTVPKNTCVVATQELSLLDLDVTGGQLGLVSNGLGSSDGKNCSTDNGRITGQETLTLTLNLPGLVVDWAELDMEGKFGAELAVTTNGTTTEEPLSSGSDNGADAGESDNTTVHVGTPPASGAKMGPADDDFVAVTLGVSSNGDDRGALSLEGGGDYSTQPPQRTVLHLVSRTDYEFALGCAGVEGQTSSYYGGVLVGVDTSGVAFDSSFGLDGTESSGAQGYLVTRYDSDSDAASNATCDPIGADLSSDGPEALFRKTIEDLSGDPETPAIRITLQWKVPLTLSPEELEDELDREIDLDPLGDSNPQPVEYCTKNNDTAAGPARATSPGGIPWCLLSETIDVVDGYLLQTQVYDGAGDPRWQ